MKRSRNKHLLAQRRLKMMKITRYLSFDKIASL